MTWKKCRDELPHFYDYILFMSDDLYPIIASIPSALAVDEDKWSEYCIDHGYKYYIEIIRPLETPLTPSEN